jgi:hypothetical protein
LTFFGIAAEFRDRVAHRGEVHDAGHAGEVLQHHARGQRVEVQAAVRAQLSTVRAFDRTGLFRQVSGEELREWTFADEADAGAVSLVEHRQAGALRTRAHLGFLELADREQHLRKARALHAAEEIGLILARIRAAQQHRAVGGLREARVVPGRKPARAEALRVVQADAELDFAIAQHVGVRRASAPILVEEFGEHALAVLGLEADPVQHDAQFARGGARVLVILRIAAMDVFVVPVAHVQAVHLMPGLDETQRRDGRIDAARHANDHALCTCPSHGQRSAPSTADSGKRRPAR